MFRNNYMEFHINLKSVIIIEMETDIMKAPQVLMPRWRCQSYIT